MNVIIGVLLLASLEVKLILRLHPFDILTAPTVFYLLDTQHQFFLFPEADALVLLTRDLFMHQNEKSIGQSVQLFKYHCNRSFQIESEMN